MKRLLKKMTIGILGIAIVWCMAGWAMLLLGKPSPRGEFVSVDGRQQRIVCMGEREAGAPLVVFEAGAYSASPDWGFIQPEAAKFARTCSYDRAGMGWSEPSDAPRTVNAMTEELRALLKASGEDGPYILVGHSMAGLLVQNFAALYPDDIVGAVLIDAATPEAIQQPGFAQWIERYRKMANVMAAASKTGAIKPLAPFKANSIGLPDGDALTEKKYLFGNPRHLKATAAEINQIRTGTEGISRGKARYAQIPISVITASPVGGTRHAVADLSPSGAKIGLPGATHTSILGPEYGMTTAEQIRRIYLDVTK